ncbi:hypothetical protein BDZ45DRAFT_740889 [Acephala macrosclerotiorum]|nr:hypothetical protein BDZ45DRAFT_740889 [Acephala macrosclerotiorum]
MAEATNVLITGANRGMNRQSPLLNLPLLQEGLKIKKEMGKFVFISSGYGSITTAANPFPFDCAQYGASKAALNHIARKLHVEVQDVCIFPAHPGWLNTDMGSESAQSR